MAAHAQTTVTIGTGTSNSNSTAGPMYISSASSTFKYSKHIAIYSAAEITAAGGISGMINKIRWYKTNTGGYTGGDAQMDIFMKGVSFTTHAGTPVDWATEVAGATQVYSSTTQNLSTTTGWEEFILTTPFFWNGTDNIEIFVDWYRPGNATGGVNWQYTSTTNANAITGASSAVSTASRNANRPNIQLDFLPPVNLDAAIAGIISPSSPSNVGPVQITVNLANYGTDTLTSAKLNYSVNGVAGLATPFAWTGSLANNTTTGPLVIGSHNMTTGTHEIKAWVTEPNGSTDGFAGNDTATITIMACASLSGVYTIDASQPTAGTNFQSFTEAADRLNVCGVSGPVEFVVASTSGPYNEQFEIGDVPGASAINTITFRGNNATISFDAAVAGNEAVIRLNGSQYVTIDSLNIVVPSTAARGWGIHLTNGSAYNTISNNNITLPVTSTSTGFNGILAVGATYTAAGANANHTVIKNNTVTGGYYGLAVRGTGSTTQQNSYNNQIVGNKILDFYIYGMYLAYNDSTLVEGNEVARPARATVSTFYGIYNYYSRNSKIDKNRVHSSAGSGTSTSAAYPIYVYYSDSPAGSETRVTNNLVYNINSNGIAYGIQSYYSSGVYIYHNTVSLDHSAATTSSATYGIYQVGASDTNNEVRNNIVSITRGGSGIKSAVDYDMNTMVSDHNILYVNASNANIGTLGTSRFATLAAWQAANGNAFDQNSDTINPQFTNPAAGNFVPGNLAINNTADVIPEIEEDILGRPRSNAAADPGAFEFQFPNDLQVMSIVSPVSGCGVSSAATVEVVVRNLGTSPKTGFDLGYSLNGVAITPESIGNVTVPAGGTYTYTFSTPANMGTPNAYTLEAYTILSTDAEAGNDTATAVIVLASQPVAPNATDVEICGPGAATLTATGGGSPGLSYRWFAEATGGLMLADSSGFTIPSVTADTAFYVEAYVGSCFSPRTRVEVIVNPLPVVDLGNDTTICSNSNLTLDAGNPGMSYNWSTNDTTQTISVNAPGTYTVDVTDAKGCTSRGYITISHKPRPVVTFLANVVGGDSVSFTNRSEKNATYSWDFGDGNTSTLEHPGHRYTASGAYTVTLSVTTACGTFTSQQSVVITVTGIADELNKGIQVYPNPSDGKFEVKVSGLDQDVMLKVMSLTGQTIAEKRVQASAAAETTQPFDLSSLAKGIYLLHIESASQVLVKKIVIE